MDIITSTSNKRIKEIKKLRQNKYRKQEKKFIVETLHLIEEAKKNDKLLLVITDDLDYKEKEVEVIYVSDNVMKSLSSFHTSSHYIAVVSYLNNHINYDSDIVVLESLQDPGNMGTILRNALAFGYDNILISDDCVDIYNEKLIQSSQGSIFSLNIKVADLTKEVECLKDNGYLLVGSSLNEAVVLDQQSSITQKCAIFFGNEGQGLSVSLLECMDINYKIAITGIDSLNVASASAIFFYQLNKKNT